MFAQNTVKRVDCQHLKICKVNVRNTEVFIGRTRQASRGDLTRNDSDLVFGNDGGYKSKLRF